MFVDHPFGLHFYRAVLKVLNYHLFYLFSVPIKFAFQVNPLRTRPFFSENHQKTVKINFIWMIELRDNILKILLPDLLLFCRRKSIEILDQQFAHSDNFSFFYLISSSNFPEGVKKELSKETHNLLRRLSGLSPFEEKTEDESFWHVVVLENNLESLHVACYKIDQFFSG